MLFFFFSFLSFGFANPNRRVEDGGAVAGVWLGPSGTTLLVWLAELSMWKGPLSLYVREMLFLFGDTESSESNDPDLATGGVQGKGDSSRLGRKDGILSSLVCGWETCTHAREGAQRGGRGAPAPA